MKNNFLAKSNPIETIQQHTLRLLKGFEILKTMYPDIKYVNWDILKLACKYHDLGKMNTKFQNKIISKIQGYEKLEDKLENVKEVQHGYLSPAFLPEDKLREMFNKDELRILYQSIYYHHVRYSNDLEDIKLTIKEDLEKYYKDFIFDEISDIESLNTSYQRYIGGTNGRGRIKADKDEDNIVKTYIVTKGLLNKLDYTSSSTEKIDVEYQHDNLDEKVFDFFDKKDYKLNDLQEFMLNNKESNNIIIASTGIGKTEAALLWIGKDKGFFTLPLRVSINAIYDRVIGKIGHLKKSTGLLHSDTVSEYLKRNGNDNIDDEYIGQTKQLTLPLTICTVDQLIDYIFKYDGYECKLATLSYSKLIIDEIQMYSPQLIGYLIVAMKQMVELGGKFSILTATLPPIFIDFIQKLDIPFNEPKIFLKNQTRHRLRVINNDINVEDILNDYMNDKKILVIVNTVKVSQALYEKIDERGIDNIYLLHGRFIKRDRRKKENEIIEFGKLENEVTGIWITTQIVEASLDIDFDVLYTELSDISGLLQRMGRVYRNRELLDDRVNVNVFTGIKRTSGVGKGKIAVIDEDIFELSKKEIQKYNMCLIDEKMKMDMVSNVYTKENLEGTFYYDELKRTIDYVKEVEEYTFSKNENRLREIYSEAIIPISVYEKNKDIINTSKSIIDNKESKKEDRQKAKDNIQDFIVYVPGHSVISFIKKHGIYTSLKLSKYSEVFILEYYYDENIGLTNPDEEDSIRTQLF